VTSWPAVALGLPANATLRCLLPLPDALAIGADRGLVLRRGDRFLPFPWPQGARAHSRVEAMALHEGVLHVATTRARFRWALSGPVTGSGMPLDKAGVYDEVRAMHSGRRLLVGWRTHLEGASGPPGCCAFAEAVGTTWAGTLDGRLTEIDGEEIRRFDGPVRHLAGDPATLWVAAGGALHRFDGERWTSTPGEPYALCLHRGALISLRDGRLWRNGEPDPTELGRPWSLASTDEGLWVGRVGGLSLFR